MPGHRRPIFPRWYLPTLAVLLVGWTAMEGVNLQRNRQAGEVFWLNSPFRRLGISDDGGWTVRWLRLPVGTNHAVVGGSLWWTLGNLLEGSPRQPYGLAVGRLQPDGHVQVFDLTDAVAGWEWPHVRELTAAPNGVWVATGRGPGQGHPRQTALFEVDVTAGTYRLVPGMGEAETSPDGHTTAMLGLDGVIHVTGARARTVTCPPDRIDGLHGDFAADRLVLETSAKAPGPVGPTDHPTFVVDLRTGRQTTLLRRSRYYVDFGEGEWWVTRELFPHGPCRTVVYDPFLMDRRRRLWTGAEAWAMSQVGHVDPPLARLFEALSALSTETTANAPRTRLREAAEPPLAKTP